MSRTVDVLVSGRGSNLRALVDAGVVPRQVISDKECEAIYWAQSMGFATAVVPFERELGRDAFSDGIFRAVTRVGEPDLVVCAGFMRILTQPFFRLKCPVVNIHPSLLPAFKGANAQQMALDAAVLVTGATVHLVTEELDAGPIIGQIPVWRYADDDLESLQKRILEVEHKLLPFCVQALMRGDIEVSDGKLLVPRDWTQKCMILATEGRG